MVKQYFREADKVVMILDGECPVLVNYAKKLGFSEAEFEDASDCDEAKSEEPVAAVLEEEAPKSKKSKK